MKFSAQHQAAWPEPCTKSRGGFDDDDEEEEGEALASRTSRSQAPSKVLTKRWVTDDDALAEEAEAIVEFLRRLSLSSGFRSARGKYVATGTPRVSFKGASIAEEVRFRAGMWNKLF